MLLTDAASGALSTSLLPVALGPGSVTAVVSITSTANVSDAATGTAAAAVSVNSSGAGAVSSVSGLSSTSSAPSVASQAMLDLYGLAATCAGSPSASALGGLGGTATDLIALEAALSWAARHQAGNASLVRTRGSPPPLPSEPWVPPTPRRRCLIGSDPRVTPTPSL